VLIIPLSRAIGVDYILLNRCRYSTIKKTDAQLVWRWNEYDDDSSSLLNLKKKGRKEGSFFFVCSFYCFKIRFILKDTMQSYSRIFFSSSSSSFDKSNCYILNFLIEKKKQIFVWKRRTRSKTYTVCLFWFLLFLFLSIFVLVKLAVEVKYFDLIFTLFLFFFLMLNIQQKKIPTCFLGD